MTTSDDETNTITAIYY